MISRAGRVLLAFLRSATTLRERSSPRVIPICYGHVRLNVSGLFPVSPRETLHFGADFPGLDNNDCVGDARRLRGIVHHSNFVRLTSGLGSRAVMRSTRLARPLFPQRAADVVAPPRLSGSCHNRL